MTFQDFFVIISYNASGGYMKNLKNLREKFNLKQADMAKIMHVSRVSYCNYENDVNQPSLDSLILLADYFHVSVDYILGRNAHQETIPFYYQDLEDLKKAYNLLKKILENK